MAQPYITFNGVKSTTLGVIVEKLPDFHRAARRYTQTEIPGSSVPIIADEGGCSPYQTQFRINANGTSLRTVYQWLSGEGWLVSSDEPDFKVYAYLYPQVTDSRFRVGNDCFDSLAVTALVEPYRRLADEETIELTAAATILGRGQVNALPKISIWGSGNITLMVNESTVMISGLGDHMTIDSEAGTATRHAGDKRTWMGEKVTLLNGWPELLPDNADNPINWVGQVERVRIYPNWRYL